MPSLFPRHLAGGFKAWRGFEYHLLAVGPVNQRVPGGSRTGSMGPRAGCSPLAVVRFAQIRPEEKAGDVHVRGRAGGCGTGGEIGLFSGAWDVLRQGASDYQTIAAALKNIVKAWKESAERRLRGQELRGTQVGLELMFAGRSGGAYSRSEGGSSGQVRRVVREPVVNHPCRGGP